MTLKKGLLFGLKVGVVAVTYVLSMMLAGMALGAVR